MLTGSLSNVAGEARRQTQLFIRQEVQLAKAEVSEKVSLYGRSATQAGIGAGILYAAALVLLAGLGLLLSFVLQSAGLDLIPARSAGFGGLGLLVIVVGALLLVKGIKSISKTPMAPTKTMYTVQRVTTAFGGNGVKSLKPAVPKRPVKQLETEVLATQQRLGRNFEALAGRVSPTRLLRKASAKVQLNPIRWNLAALTAGFAGSVWFVKRLRK